MSQPIKKLKPVEEYQERAVNLEEIDDLIADSPSPDFVEDCRRFREQFEEGDEILEFCTSAALWQGMAGRQGLFPAPERR